MGVIPFTFEEGTSWQSLGLKGDEKISLRGLSTLKPHQRMIVEITDTKNNKLRRSSRMSYFTKTAAQA